MRIGKWSSGDWFQFWLDDVKICLVYTYDTSNPLIYPFFVDTIGVDTFKGFASENPGKHPVCNFMDGIVGRAFVLQDLQRKLKYCCTKRI